MHVLGIDSGGAAASNKQLPSLTHTHAHKVKLSHALSLPPTHSHSTQPLARLLLSPDHGQCSCCLALVSDATATATSTLRRCQVSYDCVAAPATVEVVQFQCSYKQLFLDAPHTVALVMYSKLSVCVYVCACMCVCA